MPKVDVRTFRGRQLAAARVLAGMTVRDLCERSGVNKSTVVRLEAMDVIEVTLLQRHGYVASRTWDAIAGALAARGVELFPAADGRGAGVRWVKAGEQP